MSFRKVKDKYDRGKRFQANFKDDYSPFCVQAKIIKLVWLKNGGRLSPINLVTFAGTQNGE
jgi:hypothetical protein